MTPNEFAGHMKLLDTPLVSIVIPVFNGERFIGAALESAFSQRDAHFEVIVVDDGSTDQSAAIARTYGDGIKLISQPNLGVSVARNAGARASTGKYLAFLDADDVWDPQKCAWQAALLESHPDAVACYCDHSVIDQQGAILQPTAALFGPRCSGIITRELLEFTVIVTPSLVMMRRDEFDRTGGFPEGLRIAEDIDFWLRLSALGPILYDVRTLVSYRRHDENTYKGPTAETLASKIVAVQHFLQSLPDDAKMDLREKAALTITKRMADLAYILSQEENFTEALRFYCKLIVRKPSFRAALGLVNCGMRFIGRKFHII